MVLIHSWFLYELLTPMTFIKEWLLVIVDQRLGIMELIMDLLCLKTTEFLRIICLIGFQELTNKENSEPKLTIHKKDLVFTWDLSH